MRVVPVVKWASYMLLVGFCSAVLSAQAPAAQKTATDAYMEYRVAFDKAKKIEDVMPFMATDIRKEVESTPAKDRPQMFEMIKMMNPSGVKIVKEARTATGATLTAQGVNPMDKSKASGEIEMIREGSGWKVGKENWK